MNIFLFKIFYMYYFIFGMFFIITKILLKYEKQDFTKETVRNYAYYIQFHDKSIKTPNEDNKNVPIYV